MNLSEYAKYDGLGLAALVEGKEVRARELAELALQAIDSLNPQLNAVTETYPERTGQAQITGPFTGVPFLLKDTGAAERGRRQECGSRIGEGYIARGNSYLTEHYRNAGFNILGRTTMPELAQAATTESAYTSATCNPWDTSRSTGGSSGGSAAAVAAGMTPIAHGTDTGGSIRIPAACCGLVGLKPSRGRISKGPGLDETLYGGLNTEHVLTRSVRDTAAVLDASCQPCPGDPETIIRPTNSFSQAVTTSLKPLRIAFGSMTPFGTQVDVEMQSAVGQIARQCESMGHRVEEAMPVVNAEQYGEADKIVWAYSTYQEARRLSAVTGHNLDAAHLEPPTLDACEFARKLSLDDWFVAMSTYNEIRRDIGSFFQSYDLLLTPTVASVAPQLGVLNSNRAISFDQFMQITGDFCPHTALFNVTGQPAISLPLCMSDTGLPIGLQFVARFGEEATLLSIASDFEQAMPWQDRIPDNHISYL